MSSFGFVFIRSGELKVSYSKSIASVRKPGKEIIILEVFSVPEQFAGDRHYKSLLGHQKITEHRLKMGGLSLPRVSMKKRKRNVKNERNERNERHGREILPAISEDGHESSEIPEIPEIPKKKFEIIVQDPIEVSYYSESDFDSRDCSENSEDSEREEGDSEA